MGLLHGFGHSLGGLDHVLAVVAVGVLAFLLGGRAPSLAPAASVAMMLVSVGLGVGQVPVPLVELGIALSGAVSGGAAALGRPMPVGAAMALVGVFAVFHGHAHGAERPDTAGRLAYASGFVAATALLHASGVILAFAAASRAGRHGRAAARRAGGAFAAGGIGILARWL